jgi:hypothetical protein
VIFNKSGKTRFYGIYQQTLTPGIHIVFLRCAENSAFLTRAKLLSGNQSGNNKGYTDLIYPFEVLKRPNGILSALYQSYFFWGKVVELVHEFVKGPVLSKKSFAALLLLLLKLCEVVTPITFLCECKFAA